MTSYPKPKWQPVDYEDSEVIRGKMCEYTDQKRAFVVFRHGTVVFSDSSSARSDEDYVLTLKAAVLQAPDFNVVPMNDGNLMVRFLGPVTGFVETSFFAERLNEIQSNIDDGGLLPGENVVPSSSNDDSSTHYYAGLYARAKLYADVEHCDIAVRYVPS